MTSNRVRSMAWLCAVIALVIVAYRHLPARAPLSPDHPKGGRASAPNLALPPAQVASPRQEQSHQGTSSSAPAPALAQARHAEALDRLTAFTNWLTEWRRSGPADQARLASVGPALAADRRAALKYLIEVDPQAALDSAVPVGLRSELPPPVQAQLERRIDARGYFEVTVACNDTEARYDRTVLVDGTGYRAFVYGRRLAQLSKEGVPVHGIAIDDAFAYDELPYRQLDDMEKAARGIAADQLAVLVGPELKLPAGNAELDTLKQQLVDAEAAPAPRMANAGSAAAGPNVPTAAVTSPQSWIFGTKRVLWLKVDFNDDVGPPATDDDINASNPQVSTFYDGTSYSDTAMSFTILPAVLRMPKDKAYYNTSMSTTTELSDAASAQAKAYDAANGGTGAYDPDKYDRWVVVFRKIPAYTFGGQASLGGPRVRLNNNVAASTLGHELGHTQSLDHSHAWLPAGSSAMGAGTHVEYGDPYDRMGNSSSGPNNFFNVSQKAKLGYLDASSITSVAQSGTYRLTRHDHVNSTGVRALKIPATNVEYDYWIEYRRFGPTSFTPVQLDRLQNGVLLHWGPGKSPRFTSGPGSYLLDMTPGSAGGFNDAALRIGESFVDPDAGITVKPLAVGGTAPNEYIDVQISFGAVDGNHNPTLQFDPPAATLNARTNYIFNASGSDPDGDPVYFRWDFGDGSLQPNLNSITRRFTKGGTYTLNVSAHDGKGGIAAKSVTLNVVDPLASWTQQAIGLTTNQLIDVIYAGGKFVAVGLNNTVLTSPDGVAWSRQSFPTGISLLGIASNGARYVAAGRRFNATSDRFVAAYSDDAVTWTTVTIPSATSSSLNGAAYGAGHFVVVGDDGRIYSSADGATWTSASSGVTTSLRAVSYADGLFVASGDSGRILISADGVNWANKSVATSNTLGAIARHNGTWYVASATVECYSSSDGNSWTRTATAGRTGATQRLISTGGVLLGAASGGNIALTEDPKSWTMQQISSLPNASFWGVAQGNGTLVMVGISAPAGATTSGLIYTATVPTTITAPLIAPALRNDGDALKVAVGKPNALAGGGSGFTKLELYANGTKVSELNAPSGPLTWTPSTFGNYSLSLRGVDANGYSVFSANYAARAGLDTWNIVNPGPAACSLNSAVRANGKWWIVGYDGSFFTLDSNGTVTPVDFSTRQRLTWIGYANGRFIVTTLYTDAGAHEDIGSIWTSTDGYAWTPLLTSILEAVNLSFVTYANGKWLVTGTGGTLMTSVDGLTWTRQVSGLNASIQAAAYGNGTWVAVASGGAIISSADGVAWTKVQSQTTNDLWSVAFNNGSFVAVGISGTILRSTDGTTWTKITSPTASSLFAAASWKDTFVIAGNSGNVLTSSDGNAWTAASLGGNSSDIFAVAPGDNDALLVGRYGEIYTATAPASWTRLTHGTTDSRLGIVYAAGKFVAVGQATDGVTRAAVPPVSVSTDGVAWSRVPSDSALTALNAITYGQGRFVAVGPGSAVFTSTDGLAWTKSTFATSSASLNAVAAGPDLFVAAGSGLAIYSSPDGATWTTRASGLGVIFRAAAYGNSHYVVVGDNGTVMTSSDGTSWTKATSGTTANLQTVVWYPNYGFIAAGTTGTMIASDDGVSWTSVETGVADTIGAITLTPLGLVAAAGTNGTLLLSLDGASWTIATLPADRTVRGLAASASAIVAVGDNGLTETYEITDSTPAPKITTQPTSMTSAVGSSVTLSADAQNAYKGVYQWMKDGVPIVGANAPTYSISSLSSAQAGDYTVSVTTPTGVVTSRAATVAIAAVSNPGRLINLSILTSLSDANDSFTVGFNVGGAGTVGTKPLLIRAVGPSLAAYGVGGTIDDPKLDLFNGSTRVGSNDNWGGDTATSQASARVGAFPFSGASSKDSAFYLPGVNIGGSSAKVSGTGAGTVLAEVYDATPSDSFTAATPRLINISVLKNIGTGLTAGFYVGGATPRTVLIRAVGPSLSSFGLTGTLADPKLALFSGSTQIDANDNWGGTSALGAAFAQVGAFALPLGSKDAAVVKQLQPGSYTVQISSADGGTGVALIEIYEVP